MQDMILHVKLHTDVQLELMEYVYWEQNIKSACTESKTEYKHIFFNIAYSEANAVCLKTR